MGMSIIGIDPGASKSAFVLWSGKQILDKGLHPNENILRVLQTIRSMPYYDPVLAIESMIHIHIPKTGKLKAAGKEILDTVRWEGQFYRAWEGQKEFVPGHVIKKALGTTNDSGIRAALITRFGHDFCRDLRGKGYHLYRAFAVAVVHMDHLEFQSRELK